MVHSFPIALLARMRCHLCLGQLRFAGDGRAEAHVRSGIVACRCSRFPIVEGVLILRADVAEIVDAIASSDREALIRCMHEHLEVSPELLDGRERTLLDALTTQTLVDLSRAEWRLHQAYWHRTPKYLAARPVIGAMRTRAPQAVLDLGAGAGHLGMLVEQYARPELLVLLDISFASLFLAERLFVGYRLPPRICADARFGLPFVDNAFDAVINADSFHCFDAKAHTLADVRRVLVDDGFFAFTHLHNAACPEEPFQGYSLQAETWTQLFRENLGPDLRVLSDEAIRHQVIGKHAGAACEDGLPGLERSFTAMLSATIPQAFDVPMLEAGPHRECVNPYYNVKEEDARLLLSRRTLTDTFENEFDYPEPPKAFELDRASLSDVAYRRMLHARGILIDAPPNLAPELHLV